MHAISPACIRLKSAAWPRAPQAAWPRRTVLPGRQLSAPSGRPAGGRNAAQRLASSTQCLSCCGVSHAWPTHEGSVCGVPNASCPLLDRQQRVPPRWPRLTLSFASMSAPRSSSRVATATWSRRVAQMSAVQPFCIGELHARRRGAWRGERISLRPGRRPARRVDRANASEPSRHVAGCASCALHN